MLLYAAVLHAEARVPLKTKTTMVLSSESLGNDRHSAGDPLGNICGTHPFVRGKF
jgi:hypothetical protein